MKGVMHVAEELRRHGEQIEGALGLVARAADSFGEEAQCDIAATLAMIAEAASERMRATAQLLDAIALERVTAAAMPPPVEPGAYAAFAAPVS
jgi:hypothetical protein